MSYFLGWAWIPLFSGLVFLGGLIAMLASWAGEGHPQYQAKEGSIVYISDVGAHLKPLFISTLAATPRISDANICFFAWEFSRVWTDFSDLCDYGPRVCVESGD
jgi:hypothetical protein